MSQWRLVLVSQASMLVFALVISYAPQLYWAVLLVYFIVLGSTMFMAQRRFTGKVSANEVLMGRRLYAEDKAMDIAVKDEELTRELAAQFRPMVMSFVGLVIAIAVFWLFSAFHGSIVDALKPVVGSEKLANFLYWVIVFETVFIATRVTGYAFAGGLLKGSQPPFIPSKYVVTDRGIAIPGALGVAIPFPLPSEYRVTLNERRGFVEIVDGKGRRIRLYARNPRRLYELIVSLNRRALERKKAEG